MAKYKKSFKELPLKEARKIQLKRTKKSRIIDRRSTSKNIVTDERWKKNPSKYDYPDLDTKKIPYKEYKKLPYKGDFKKMKTIISEMNRLENEFANDYRNKLKKNNYIIPEKQKQILIKSHAEKQTRQNQKLEKLVLKNRDHVEKWLDSHKSDSSLSNELKRILDKKKIK